MNNAGINQYTLQRRPIGTIIWSWVAAVASLLFLVPAGGMVVADAAAYRPCSINSSGLSVRVCGRRSLDMSDLVLIGLFLGALLIVICATTHAVRMSRKTR